MGKAYLFVVSGPSAVGKSSIVNEILKRDNTLDRIITCTTREKRKSEKHGEDYLFFQKNDFLSEIDRGNLIEFSEVYGNYYGIMLSTVEEKINAGRDSILIINWDGFLKIKSIFKERVCGLFILPPTIAALEMRIRQRGEDSPETIARRIGVARKDIGKSKFYDFRFKNSDIATTAGDILEKINDVRQGRVR
ncbi:MAG: guanylate kinase [Holosporaceae bacterium]|jgi:guanylate kinase|nr:guanylate kinase [Holosporaceae bacterium]